MKSNSLRGQGGLSEGNALCYPDEWTPSLLPVERPIVRLSRASALWRLAAQLAIVVALLCLAAANIHQRITWSEMDDGVLWGMVDEQLAAREVAPDSPAARAGVRPGDQLHQINGGRVESEQDVIDILHEARRDETLTYGIVRAETAQVLSVPVDFMPSGARGLYYVLASVGIFTLFVGAGVRLRRPDNQATLHFFWL